VNGEAFRESLPLKPAWVRAVLPPTDFSEVSFCGMPKNGCFSGQNAQSIGVGEVFRDKTRTSGEAFRENPRARRRITAQR
jgi:hypothetical protein